MKLGYWLCFGMIFHFLGMATYITWVDEKFCQGEYNFECYEWKGVAGFWEIVVIQETIIRPLIRKSAS